MLELRTLERDPIILYQYEATLKGLIGGHSNYENLEYAQSVYLIFGVRGTGLQTHLVKSITMQPTPFACINIPIIGYCAK